MDRHDLVIDFLGWSREDDWAKVEKWVRFCEFIELVVKQQSTVDLEKLALEVEFTKKALGWRLYDRSQFGASELFVTIKDEGARGVIHPDTDYEDQKFVLTDQEFEILNR